MPVTASYIICAVIAAPALIQLGVADFAAHMFIFYYAGLSEVSPPTALSLFPYVTTLQSCKDTMPAFLVPFMFVLDPSGLGLLDWIGVAHIGLAVFAQKMRGERAHAPA